MRIDNDISGSADLKSGVITILDAETRTPGLGLDDPMAPLTRHYTLVIDTKEKLVRDALIQLGWTPPAEQPVILHSKRENAG